ncbi:helix-turn-helix domain-containing protein [Nocardioides acrostichi]|uniref:helix-turn-helix domain-containing protein n=1 Tax=Nocardioides acrostichi TaxID=2784339 RepID=UPI002E29DD89|nr:GAF domain-containing protein [Nocardioides acrostichi]
MGVSRCSVYLRITNGLFQGRAGYCAREGCIDKKVSRLVSGVQGDQFTSEIVQGATPVLVQNAATDPRTIQKTMRRWGVCDMLGVPLVVGEEVIGIIYADSPGQHHRYQDADVSLAQAFAGLATLVVVQSWRREQAEAQREKLERRTEDLGLLLTVGDLATRLISERRPLADLLRPLVTIIDKPVAVHDASGATVAWAAPQRDSLKAAPGLTPEEFELPWVAQALSECPEDASVVLKAQPRLRYRRLVVPVVVSDAVSGYLEVCELGRRLTARDAAVLERVARTYRLARHAEPGDGQATCDSSAFLSGLLSRRGEPESLPDRAEAVGIDLTHAHVLLHVSQVVPDDPNLGGRRESVADVIGRAGGSCVAHTSRHGADLFLIESSRRGAADISDEVAGAVDSALRAVEARGEQVGFVIASHPLRSLQEVPSAASRLEQIAEILEKVPSAVNAWAPQIVHERDLQLVRLIANREGLQGAVQDSRGLLAPLLEHDRVHDSQLVTTLRAYLAAQGRIRPTALGLAVHENTVRYRLGRIRELSSVEPERLDSLLGAAAAFQILDLLESREAVSSATALPLLDDPCAIGQQPPMSDAPTVTRRA